jgi:hypothetical protein
MRRASSSATLPAPPLDAEAAERRREYRSHGRLSHKAFRQGRCALTEVGAREAERDEIASAGQRATEGMAVFGAQP